MSRVSDWACKAPNFSAKCHNAAAVLIAKLIATKGVRALGPTNIDFWILACLVLVAIAGCGGGGSNGGGISSDGGGTTATATFQYSATSMSTTNYAFTSASSANYLAIPGGSSTGTDEFNAYLETQAGHPDIAPYLFIHAPASIGMHALSLADTLVVYAPQGSNLTSYSSTSSISTSNAGSVTVTNIDSQSVRGSFNAVVGQGAQDLVTVSGTFTATTSGRSEVTNLKISRSHTTNMEDDPKVSGAHEGFALFWQQFFEREQEG